MPTDAQSLFDQSKCYLCLGVSQADALALALLAQVTAGGDDFVNVHTNVAAVVVTSPAGTQTLLDSPASTTLAQGNVLFIEGSGVFGDPGANVPNATLSIVIAGVNVLTQVKAVTNGEQWYLRAMVTIRAGGAGGSVVAAMQCLNETVGGTLGTSVFPFAAQVNAVNLTGTPSINVTGTIDNVAGTESITVDQLTIIKV